MLKRAFALLALATLMGGATGCTYFADRGADLMDIAGIELITGLQGGASVRATKAVQVGLAGASGDVAAWDGRSLGCFDEARFEAGVGPIYSNYAMRHVHASNDAYDRKDFFDEFEKETYDLNRAFDRDFFEIGARVHAFFLGVGVQVNPVEMGDFLLGIFGIDYARDDTRNQGHYDVPPGIGWPRLLKDEDDMDMSN